MTPNTVHQSGAGSQYTAIRYGERLAEAGLQPSIASVGDSFDNALAEAVNALREAERTRGPGQGPWRNIDDLKLATLGWVIWFNAERHGTLGDVPPAEYEATTFTQRRPTSRLEPNEPSLQRTRGGSVVESRGRLRMFRTVAVPGRGTAGRKKYQPPGKAAEIKGISGIDKVPGSLNLRPSTPIWLRSEGGMPFRNERLYRGWIGDVEVVFRPHPPGRRPLGVRTQLLLVYSNLHLKSHLGFEDGDVVTLRVRKSDLSRITLLHQAARVLRAMRRRVRRVLLGLSTRSGPTVMI